MKIIGPPPARVDLAPAGLWLDRHRELVDRLVEGRLLQIHARQLVGLLRVLVVGDAPLAGLLVQVDATVTTLGGSLSLLTEVACHVGLLVLPEGRRVPIV